MNVPLSYYPKPSGGPLAWHFEAHEKSFSPEDLDLLQMGTKKPSKPPMLHLKGTKRVDFVYSYQCSLLLMSSDVVQLFEGKAFSGWSVFPVRFVGRQPSLQFFGWVITGRATGRILYRSPLKASLESWDGSDMCRLEGRKLLTARVVDAITEAKFTGLEFPEVEWAAQ